MARLSLLVANLGGGGAQGVCVTLANGLADRGHDVEIVALTTRDARRMADVSAQVRIVDLGVQRARSAWRPLVAHYRAAPPDAVLAFAVELWVLMMAVRWRMRARFRLVVRTINTLSAVAGSSPSLTRRWLDYGLRVVYRRADHVVAQSQGMAAELMERYRVPRDRLGVIPNPVSPALLAGGEQSVRLPVEGPYLLYAGRLEPQKGLDRLLAAFAHTMDQCPELQLVMLGDGSLKEGLEAQAEELGAGDRVHFLGYQNDLEPWYRHACATVLTSHYEGLPNVLIESIALGTPVVSFDCPNGPSEIVVDGVNGYLVPEGDLDRLSDAFLNILAGNIDREAVRGTANRYLAEHVVARYESLLVSGRPLGSAD
ncbi:glycosyltransferase [Thioalkalivibrio sp. ALJ7]|uniref:glycosyltransferase n=1 Tax=Thioalkalivibrio sp. ALJ7 TaxID=1158756 RepID=UPI00035CA272|nr:glycosyltransferase [Thioalkalivibrio sp. ALJ7]